MQLAYYVELNNILEEYMEFGESSFCICFTVGDYISPRA